MRSDLQEIKIKITLDAFVDELKKIFDEKLYACIIYGSLVLNDFIEGKGDIDFFVVLKNHLTEQEISQIILLHEKLRTDDNILSRQLEGAYYTIQMFNKPHNESIGYYVGTRRKGWKTITKLTINSFERKNIIEHGVVIYGNDMRHLIELPSLFELKNDFLIELNNRIKLLDDLHDINFIIDTIYFTLRGISIFKYEKMVSKSEAMYNYLQMCKDELEYQFIQLIANYRCPLFENEIREIDQNTLYDTSKSWINKIYLEYNRKDLNL